MSHETLTSPKQNNLIRGQTLKVIMLNNETFPPAADITYESFFDRAMHGTASSRLTPMTSFDIRRPLFGCQCCGARLAVAFKEPCTSELVE